MGVVVAMRQVGPIRAQVEAYGGAIALFNERERTLILRTAMQAAGDVWIAVFLPLRFSPYAKHLGYYVSTRWRQLKEELTGQALPFVGLTPPGGGSPAPRWSQHNGEKLQVAAMRGARAKPNVAAGRLEVVILIPYGHAMRSDKAAVFKNVPGNEIGRMAKAVGEFLATTIAGSEVRTARGTTTVTANPAWRPPMAGRLATIRTYTPGVQYRTLVGARSSLSSVLRPRR